VTGTQIVEPTSPSIADILTKEVPGFGAGGGGGVTVPPLGVTLPLPPTKSASPLEPANNLGLVLLLLHLGLTMPLLNDHYYYRWNSNFHH